MSRSTAGRIAGAMRVATAWNVTLPTAAYMKPPLGGTREALWGR